VTASPNRLVATIVGALYLVFGLIGFAVASGFALAATSGGLLFGVVQVNNLQNVVHLIVGVTLVLVGRFGVATAKTGNASVGTFSLVFGLVGLFVSGSNSNIFALNGAANALHFATAIVLLAVSLGAEKAGSEQKVANR
jgi:hypothetical protein